MGRKKKIKPITKSKLPANEAFWLTVSKSKKDIEAFAERGNKKQIKDLEAVIQYRLWQIHQGEIEGDFFTSRDIDIKKLKLTIKEPPKSKVKTKVKETLTGKIIDLYDMNNITDLKKE